MITCEQLINDFLMDYAEGASPQDARRLLDEHLAVCPPCQAYVDAYLRTLKAARQAGTEPAPGQPASDRLIETLLRLRDGGSNKQ